MTTRNPLALVSGVPAELPAADDMPVRPRGIAVAAWATSPAGTTTGEVAWSTTSACLIQWNGANWAPIPFSSVPRTISTGTTDTVQATDHDLIFTKAITVTLPSAANFSGRELYLKVTAATAITSASANVVPLASTTAGTAILAATAGKWCRMVSNGTNWVVMSAN